MQKHKRMIPFQPISVRIWLLRCCIDCVAYLMTNRFA